jgi:hypothetical protein
MSWWHCNCCFKGRSRGLRACGVNAEELATATQHIYTRTRAREARRYRPAPDPDAGRFACQEVPTLAASTETNTKTPRGHLAARPWPRTTLRISRAGLLLAPNDPHRSGTVCSSHPARPPHVVHPAQDSSAPTRRSLISKHLFHRLYNSNSIASKTHEHKSVSVDPQSHHRTM